ncbi:hypothetical protein HK102_013797 [Quaeritorhiza haematococci]|nr:hypothetical protein HK102_013797 [Quaeritorhiza haematococci]
MESPQNFAKSLAHTEKKVRDKAFRALTRWLTAKPNISDLELLKLWKGLFYCFWMSDKPLVQQHLADQIASLVHELALVSSSASTNTTSTPSPALPYPLRYIKTFWKTMVREWYGIDRLRLDKFYMLLRKMHRATFQYLNVTAAWDETVVKHFVGILQAGVLKPNDMKNPNGLTYHVVDVFLEELGNALTSSEYSDEATTTIDPEILTTLISPFITFLAVSTNPTGRSRIREHIIGPILQNMSIDDENSDDMIVDAESEADQTKDAEGKDEMQTEENAENVEEDGDNEEMVEDEEDQEDEDPLAQSQSATAFAASHFSARHVAESIFRTAARPSLTLPISSDAAKSESTLPVPARNRSEMYVIVKEFAETGKWDLSTFKLNDGEAAVEFKEETNAENEESGADADQLESSTQEGKSSKKRKATALSSSTVPAITTAAEVPTSETSAEAPLKKKQKKKQSVPTATSTSTSASTTEESAEHQEKNQPEDNPVAKENVVVHNTTSTTDPSTTALQATKKAKKNKKNKASPSAADASSNVSVAKDAKDTETKQRVAEKTETTAVVADKIASSGEETKDAGTGSGNGNATKKSVRWGLKQNTVKTYHVTMPPSASSSATSSPSTTPSSAPTSTSPAPTGTTPPAKPALKVTQSQAHQQQQSQPRLTHADTVRNTKINGRAAWIVGAENEGAGGAKGKKKKAKKGKKGKANANATNGTHEANAVKSTGAENTKAGTSAAAIEMEGKLSLWPARRPVAADFM